MLVVFPTAFLTATLATDVAFWWRGDPFWAQASFWLALSGFSAGGLAAMVGFAEFLLMREVRNRLAGWTHMLAAVMALALAGANVQLRIEDPVAAVVPWGLLLSAVMAPMVGIAGWIGGTLTFGHGIGTYVHHHDEPQDDELDEPPGQ